MRQQFKWVVVGKDQLHGHRIAFRFPTPWAWLAFGIREMPCFHFHRYEQVGKGRELQLGFVAVGWLARDA